MEIRSTNFESELIIILKDKQRIVITPFKIQESGVIKLGIDAPKQVMVNRHEIYLKKQEQQKRSKT